MSPRHGKELVSGPVSGGKACTAAPKPLAAQWLLGHPASGKLGGKG